MTKPPIVLLTDFGHRDPFVGIMKGVIASRAPKASVIDLCHEIAPQSVDEAALALKASVRYFPKGSLFVTVVDPGVGSKRKIVWARTKSHSFLAPDNGIISWLEETLLECRAVEDSVLLLKPVSTTFHGRDIFAPVAASLWLGLPPSKLGPETQPFKAPFPSPKRVSGGLIGGILSFDRFGNAVTTLSSIEVPPGAIFTHRGRKLGTMKSHYAQIPPKGLAPVSGSSGLVELCARDGDFRARAKARKGDEVHVRSR